ncbi:MAG: hypothetical protein MUF87_04115 [Anaerolineae bacterium]|jgi:cell division septum initiation protein DivIVA|nr:hypothetical protein [Anaerolineae bacterium]
MDIQHLVDRLEDLIDEGRHMPFSKFTLIDEERALEIIDQMRISIPEEIEKASRIIGQRDRVLAQANEEAARILQLARQKSEQMVNETDDVKRAQERANYIIEQSRIEAANITAEADQYVKDVLSRLEQTLLRSINEVRNGLSQLSEIEAPVRATVNANVPQPVIRQTVDIER